MGYEIMYDKKFVKTERGYIPFVLCGSSNCTMFAHGKEILEREWLVYNENLIFCTKEKLYEFAESCSHTEYELFKEGSNWVCGKDIVRWFNNAINKASTIENLLKANPYRSICCYVWMTSKTEYSTKTKFLKYVKTEKELMDWYDSYHDYTEDGWNTHINIGFNGYDKMHSVGRTTGYVFVSFGKGRYLEKFDEHSYTLTRDKLHAMIFNGIDDFDEKTTGCCVAKYNHTFIKA